MKDKQQGSVSVLVLVLLALAVIGGGFYWYKTNTQGSEPSRAADDWSGTYAFTESTDADPREAPNFFTAYTLTLAKDGEGYTALIGLDGHMAFERIEAHGSLEGDGLRIVFDSYHPEKLNTGFKPGDDLFMLTISGEGKLKIEWQKMQPNLPKTDVNASYFEKID